MMIDYHFQIVWISLINNFQFRWRYRNGGKEGRFFNSVGETMFEGFSQKGRLFFFMIFECIGCIFRLINRSMVRLIEMSVARWMARGRKGFGHPYALSFHRPGNILESGASSICLQSFSALSVWLSQLSKYLNVSVRFGNVRLIIYTQIQILKKLLGKLSFKLISQQ